VPVEVVFQGFSTGADAESQIASRTGWGSIAADSQKLNMDGANGIQCRSQDAGRASATTSGGQRTYLRLWSYQQSSAGPVAGSAVRQHQTSIQNCGWAANSGGTGGNTGAGGYTTGRQLFEQSFQGDNAPYGDYPLKEYDWGNTASFNTCDNGTVASDGNVAIVQPKDDFGYSDRWFSFDPISSHPDQDPFKLAGDDGATVARYAVNWNDVGTNGSVTAGACSQRPGAWGNYDDTYENLTGLAACEDPPANYVAPIQPLLFVRNAPDQYAHVCNSDSSLTAVVDNTTQANQAWQGFVQNVADRYPAAKGIEVWNEPNLSKYWGGCDPNPARYADLLTLAHDGVKVDSANGDIPIVMGSMSPGPQPGDSNEWRTYLSGVYSALDTPGAEFNVLGLHPYRTSGDVTAGRGFTVAAQNNVTLAHTFLSNHGTAGKPIWVTEVGVSKEEPPGDPKHVDGDNQQATVLQSIYQGLRIGSSVPVVILYRFSDASATDGYGAVGQPTTFPKKPAYRCLKLTRGLDGTCP
jgi:hypothetical protein